VDLDSLTAIYEQSLKAYWEPYALLRPI
jgi:hypothetical protein